MAPHKKRTQKSNPSTSPRDLEMDSPTPRQGPVDQMNHQPPPPLSPQASAIQVSPGHPQQPSQDLHLPQVSQQHLAPQPTQAPQPNRELQPTQPLQAALPQGMPQEHQHPGLHHQVPIMVNTSEAPPRCLQVPACPSPIQLKRNKYQKKKDYP